MLQTIRSLLGQEFNCPEAKSEKFRPITTALFQGIRVFTTRAQNLNFRQLHGAIMGHEVLHTNLDVFGTECSFFLRGKR